MSQLVSHPEQSFFAEVRATLKLALPLVVGQMTNVAMVFVDTLFAGRLSPTDLAAVAVGGTIWSCLNLFVLGTLLAVPAFVAQYDGADQRHRIAGFGRQVIWLSLAMAIAVFVIVRSVEPFMTLMKITPDVVPLAQRYLEAISWGAPGYAMFYFARFYSEGLGLTRPAMYLGLIGLALNVPADYVFMYGKLGLPAMGAEGCGYATALVLTVQAIAMCWLLHRGRGYASLRVFDRFDWPRARELWQIILVGAPIGTAIFVESSLFLCATMLMGSLGTITIAGHQIALNVTAMMFMVPLGVSMAITVRVGNAAGRGDRREVRFRGLAGLKMILGIQVLTATIILAFPFAIARLYTSDTAVIAVAVELLFLAAIFQLSDGLQVAAAGALRGIKDTRVPLLLMVVAYWLVGIPLSYFLGIHLGTAGRGIWVGLIAGLTIAAIALVWRFHRLTRGADKSSDSDFPTPDTAADSG